MGYRSAMVLAAGIAEMRLALRQRKAPRCLDDFDGRRADFQDLNLNPNIFSATNHTSPKKTYRVFQWSNAKNDIVAADVPLSAEERDWK